MTIRFLQTTATIGIAAVVALAALPASAGLIIPEGKAGSALRVDDNLAPIGRIKGLGNNHGLALAASRGLLVSASLNVQSRADITRPAGVSEKEHAAHHLAGVEDKWTKVGLIRLVDLKTGAIVHQIEVPGMVHHVTVGANDRFALATHPKMGAVTIIDLETQKVVATIKTGPKPNYAVYDPKTASFYVSNAGNATISQVDPLAGTLVRTLKTPGGAEHMAIDVPGRRLFAAEADTGVVAVLNIDSGAVEKTFDVGGELHGIAYDAGKDALYVSARAKGAIAWIDLKSGKMSLEPIGPQPYHMEIDGTRLMVSSAGKNLVWAVDIASRSVVATVPTKARGHQMVVVPTN